jgi:hypothetical protein
MTITSITYNEKYHTFFYNGLRLTSITKFISQFTPEFNMTEVAEKYAAKHNKTVSDVIKEWKLKGEKSQAKGTFIHKCIEEYLLNKKQTELESVEQAKKYSTTPKELELLYQNLDKIIQDYHIVNIEGVVGDPELGIAGIFDCLLKNKITNEYFLIDWKTNGKITTENPFQSFNYPLNNLQKSDLNIYSLQVSLLKHCIKKSLDIDIQKMSLYHINEEVKEIEVLNMESALNKIFNHIKTQEVK